VILSALSIANIIYQLPQKPAYKLPHVWAVPKLYSIQSEGNILEVCQSNQALQHELIL